MIHRKAQFLTNMHLTSIKYNHIFLGFGKGLPFFFYLIRSFTQYHNNLVGEFNTFETYDFL